MTTNELRSKFLEFMKTKDHAVVPSAPVFLEDDKSTLFTTAGMQPMVPYLLGKEHPQGKRIADAQKCIRTDDIEEVGDNTHLTMFEMLGNWSLGDYFKDESIVWSWEFLTDKKWLGLDPQKIYVTVYEGDSQVPRDDEAVAIWEKLYKETGIDPEGRIQARGAEDNWWALGPIGPCGPDTEIFYYVGDEDDPKFEDTDDFVEVWNNVFMVYDRDPEGTLSELPNKNVDTGMGLERIAAMMQGVDSVFDTDLMKQIQSAINKYAGQTHEQVYKEVDSDLGRAVRIITDHMRSAVFMAADGVEPSNNDRGYVMRRLIRRAVRQALVLGIRQGLSENIAPVIIDLYKDAYPELEQNQDKVLDVLDKEEKAFRHTLDKGVREFAKIVTGETITGEQVFKLFDTYGFPPELSIEDAKRLNREPESNWDEEFQRLMNEQKERSRTAQAGQFKGGLTDHEPRTLAHHTATHIMHQALHQVLGDHIVQRGANVSSERLRFDFTHPAKLTDEEKQEIERIVNEQIEKDLKVSWKEYSTDEAFKMGAKGAFGDKYGDVVKVYIMQAEGEEPFSIEICGGPHVERTKGMGRFKIQKEESSSAGVRRIKAKLIED
ncbi:alanine--tRNA ligase [Patescibacteria group bacterium]|nr:MAG: alanine--tRNA ligase [Patescibacteria group bacterium]